MKIAMGKKRAVAHRQVPTISQLHSIRLVVFFIDSDIILSTS